MHDLPDATVDELIPYLIHNRPPNLQLVLGSRQGLRMETGELAASGELVVVTPRELRLRLDETIEFLRARLGPTVNLDACARVHEIAEGWPIAVQLAASLVEANPSQSLAGISEGAQDLGHFFEETVLSQLPQPEADFVVACSILDALHPDLCRVMTGNVHASALLERLQRMTPILTAVEGDVWLRMHPLARSAFAARFAALPDKEREELHWRAAQWLHDKGDPEAASRHALAAGRSTIAYEWISAYLYQLVLKGQLSEVLNWARLLPGEVLTLPRVRLAIGWAAALSYQPKAALEHVDALAVDGSPETLFEANLIRAAIALWADDLSRARTIVAPWGDDSPFDYAELRQIHANIASYLMLEEGEPERARYRQGLLLASRTGAERPMPSIHGALVVGLSHLIEARPRLADESAQPLLDRIEAARGRRSPASCILAPIVAAASWEQDRRDDAEAALAYRIDVIERTGIPVSVAIVHMIQSRAAFASGQETRALETLERLHALGEERRQPRLIVHSLVEQIRIQAALRRAESCELLVERLDRVLADAPGFEAHYSAIHDMAHARMLMVGSDYGAARAKLDSARTLARDRRRTRDWLEARVLLTLVGKADDPEVIASLRESLSIAEANGLVRLFADTHPQSIEVLRAFAARHPSDAEATRGFLDRVLGQSREPSARREAARPRERVRAPAMLTAKEAAILELLSTGLSNKEIARAVDVGQETVKWHLKNLFGKLNAGGRRHAVDRARALGLLQA